jgi:hypothetical protein
MQPAKRPRDEIERAGILPWKLMKIMNYGLILDSRIIIVWERKRKQMSE